MAEKKKSVVKKIAHDQEMGARRTIIEEMFNDYYKERRSIYLTNFFRGIFFGLGSVLGGTIVVALIVWIMSFFVNIPLVGPTVQQVNDKIEQSQNK